MPILPVEVLVLRGAMASSVAITLDVLSAANRLCAAARQPAAFDIRVGGSDADRARAMAGLSKRKSARGAAGLVILPGLGLSGDDEIRTRLAQPDAVAARRRLVAAVARGAKVATSCSGVFLFAAAGLLAGRRATTTWWLAPLFRRWHPDVRLNADALVVSDGPVTTAGAAMAQMDLMLALVARHAGAGIADQCARYMLMDERRAQSRYMMLSLLAASDDQVLRAEAWARRRLGTAFSVGDLARAAGLSSRTFARRVEKATGLSPVRFLRRIRVERAVELLETTKLPLEEIACRVGYAEPTTLRRALLREAGASARDLRAGLRR
jgi:transcriptional regulator GlxA family with amidase domain